ncbi:MAG: hypothetical protein ABIB65_01435 [Candidatus Margulisiibacteriota bacterium]
MELLKLIKENFFFEEEACNTLVPVYENLLESSPLSPEETKEAQQILKVLYDDTIRHTDLANKMQRYVEKNEKNDY